MRGVTLSCIPCVDRLHSSLLGIRLGLQFRAQDGPPRAPGALTKFRMIHDIQPACQIA